MARDSPVHVNVSLPAVVPLGPDVIVGATGAVRSRVKVTVSVAVSPTLSVAFARTV